MTKKIIYSINEISQITGVPAHTIRFWEKEFSKYLKPVKTPGGQRRYCAEDIDYLNRIKHLRYQEKYTIASVLKEMNRTVKENEISSHSAYEAFRGTDITQSDIKTEIENEETQ